MADTDVTAAAAALRAGGLVLLPTETVYGLAADAGNASAVAAIFEAKGRPRFNPLIAHVADVVAASRMGEFDSRAQALAEAFWPGPLTIVAPYIGGLAVCDLARAGLDTVALRAPSHPVAQALLRAFGHPVVAPSANRSGRPSPTRFADAVEETGASAAVSLDGGDCAVGLESTVVACLPREPVRLLRLGGIDRVALEAVVGPLAEAEGADAARSPGRLALHYAPNAPVRLEADGPSEGEAYLGFGPAPEGPMVLNLSAAGDLREAAANLFAMLRAADRLSPVAIAVAPIPDTGLGEAINDRLRRAAGYIG
ncbi:L-threonylcarbamoyladenylate synthase [soil metagenome]